jgi:hypothetical protein
LRAKICKIRGIDHWVHPRLGPAEDETDAAIFSQDIYVAYPRRTDRPYLHWIVGGIDRKEASETGFDLFDVDHIRALDTDLRVCRASVIDLCSEYAVVLPWQAGKEIDLYLWFVTCAPFAKLTARSRDHEQGKQKRDAKGFWSIHKVPASDISKG